MRWLKNANQYSLRGDVETVNIGDIYPLRLNQVTVRQLPTVLSQDLFSQPAFSNPRSCGHPSNCCLSSLEKKFIHAAQKY